MAATSHFNELYRAASERFPGQLLQSADKSRRIFTFFTRPIPFAPRRCGPYSSRRVSLSRLTSWRFSKARHTNPTMYECVCQDAGRPVCGLRTMHPALHLWSSSGCDACVVPTVVASESGEVLVDSKNICLQLDRRNPNAPDALMPASLRDAINEELSIVDDPAELPTPCGRRRQAKSECS